MPEQLLLRIAGEAVELYADRALYWPSRKRLCIADLHLGKDEVFRRSGIPVPRGDASADLARLDRLITHSRADTVWILGDLIHARLPHGDWQAPWRDMLNRHPGVRFAVVEGNHDRALAETGLPVERLPACIVDGPFAFRHSPVPHAEAHVIAGHLHPAQRVRGLGRIPMFWLRPDITVLPAFSAFTGGHAPEPAVGERRILCNGDALYELDP